MGEFKFGIAFLTLKHSILDPHASYVATDVATSHSIMVGRRRIDCIYCTRELLYSIVSRLLRLLMILINIHRLGTTQIYKMSCLSLHSVLQLS